MELCVNWSKAIPRFIEDFNRFKNPPDYFITFPDISAGSSFTGGGYLFIGAVIHNWMEGNFIQPCPGCERDIHVLRAGCLLSGDGYWAGLCPYCGLVKSHSKAMEVLLKGSIRGNWSNELGYKPIIQKESPYRFSIKDGLTRDGDMEEIRMDVPYWLEFMKEYYPDCLE